ncbi:hypothetical protein, partial [Rickettsiella grylli]|uniref:hypothetical protein n=1 Tax=Rickettsiella grylli TaxID=59196 RepID=UPI00117B1D03
MKKKCDLLYQLDFAQKYAIFNRDIQDGIKNIVEALKKGYLTREQCQTLLYLESFRLERCQARTGRA